MSVFLKGNLVDINLFLVFFSDQLAVRIVDCQEFTSLGILRVEHCNVRSIRIVVFQPCTMIVTTADSFEYHIMSLISIDVLSWKIH
jgi:hypothetical protein